MVGTVPVKRTLHIFFDALFILYAHKCTYIKDKLRHKNNIIFNIVNKLYLFYPFGPHCVACRLPVLVGNDVYTLIHNSITIVINMRINGCTNGIHHDTPLLT